VVNNGATAVIDDSALTVLSQRQFEFDCSDRY